MSGGPYHVHGQIEPAPADCIKLAPWLANALALSLCQTGRILAEYSAQVLTLLDGIAGQQSHGGFTGSASLQQKSLRGFQSWSWILKK